VQREGDFVRRDESVRQVRARSLFVAVAFVGSSSAFAGTTLPSDVQSAVLEVYNFDDPKAVAALPHRAVDLTGDGQPEYVVEVERSTGGSGSEKVCVNEVLQKDGAAFKEVGILRCCEYSATAATAKSGGHLDCVDGSGKTSLRYSGHWPKYERSKTRSEAKADYDRGVALFRQKRAREARPLVCGATGFPGAPIPEWDNTCAVVEMAAGDLDAAEATVNALLGERPDYAPAYVSRGAIAESRRQIPKAIEAYEHYVQIAPQAADHARVLDRIASLKKQNASR
jgi:hypothetical protein